MADQFPASKIADVIKTVLKCLNPSLNPVELRLPKKTCAGYMHKEELKTINDAHKAHVLCKDASKGKGTSLNTDGKTKHQRKLGGAVVNGLILFRGLEKVMPYAIESSAYNGPSSNEQW